MVDPATALAVASAAESLFGSDEGPKGQIRPLAGAKIAEKAALNTNWANKKRQNMLTRILMKNIMSGQGARLEQFKGGLNPMMDQITSAYSGAGQKIQQGADAAYGYRMGREVDRGYTDPIESLPPDMGFLENAQLPDLDTRMPNIGTREDAGKSTGQSFSGMNFTEEQLDALKAGQAKVNEVGLAELAGG